MCNFRFPAVLTLFLGFAFAQPVFGQSASRIDGSAIWQVTPQFLAAAPEACAKKTGDSNGDCLVAEMAKAGAPPAAVSFSDLLESRPRLRQVRDGHHLSASGFTCVDRSDEIASNRSHAEYRDMQSLPVLHLQILRL